MGPTGERHRIVQIHPTRRCNLRCVHCYSVSGPEEKDQLAPGLLGGAIRDAAAQGYTVADFSGGEPTLYRALPRLLDQAHGFGMRTTVTSNGITLDKRRLEALAGGIDLLAISLDGVPASHNRMRASPRAFERMRARLDDVRDAGIPFGFIFTLTQHNLDELEWVAEFAVEQGAGLLQVHPLEKAGRAGAMLPGQTPDATESAYAHLETLRLRARFRPKLFIQLDVLDTRLLQNEPERVFANPGLSTDGTQLSDLVSPLVIEADGTVVPLKYGFPRRYALGNLKDKTLGRLALSWRRSRLLPFRRVCQAVFDEFSAGEGLPFINWYEEMARRAAADERPPATRREPVLAEGPASA